MNFKEVYNGWNPAFNLIMEIKHRFMINNIYLVDTTLEYMIETLNVPRYNDVFEPLQINQDGSKVLIRYGLADIQKGLWEDPDSIYRECRSLVVDLYKEEIVAAPFRKFFNINEVPENSIENIMENDSERLPEIMDKLDGSMQCGVWYEDKAFMCGSMAINPNNSWRLAHGYELLTENYREMLRNHPEYTFIFEYISIRDCHVVKYTEQDQGLYLIGIRDKRNGDQLWRSAMSHLCKKYNVPLAQKEDISIEDLLDKMKKLKSYEKEGWVIRYWQNHLIKIKCDDYVHIHRLLDKLSSVNVIIENIAENRVDDLMSKVPVNYKDRVWNIVTRILEWKNQKEYLIEKYYGMAPKEDMKEFMVWVTNNCPTEVQGYVRMKHKNVPYNILKNKHGGYKRGKDLGLNYFDFEEQGATI
jgi:hypothetical protein